MSDAGAGETVYGQVKFYNSDREKRYGFIAIKGGPDLFFHINDYGALEGGDRMTRRMPMRGDRLVFKMAMGRKGPKAFPWAFADEAGVSVRVNDGPLTVRLKDLPQANRFTIRKDDLVVATFRKYFGSAGNGVGWTDVILRPSDGTLYRVHCFDSEEGRSDSTYLNRRDDLPPNVIIVEE